MTAMTAITRADVEHLARLARLELTEDELDHYAGQLDVILQSVARVSEVVADDIPPTSHPIPMQNVYREDVARPGLDRDTVAASAPAWEDDRFRVPRILDEE
jgi:aspartyl-tRNA(Asn)/glutamyl-tRNA(Gln) amidotransferase subunit C